VFFVFSVDLLIPNEFFLLCELSSFFGRRTQRLPRGRYSVGMRASIFLKGVAVLVAVACGAPRIAAADTLDAVNSVRARGCGGNKGVKRTLAHSRSLDFAAERLGAGDPLHLALKRAKYRATQTDSIHTQGVHDDGALRAVLESGRWCGEVTDRELREVGTYRKGEDLWIVLAAPLVPPPPSAAASVAREALRLVNETRAHERRCGFKSYAAAPPVKLSEQLNRAALAHSEDMAKYNYFDHGGHDGTTPAQRVSATGYRWLTTGENIASGMTEVSDAVAGWIASPGHCANLMNPKFTQMGLGYAASETSEAGVYWTQVFAVPR
jgi:uncharacterized protein YkwD